MSLRMAAETCDPGLLWLRGIRGCVDCAGVAVSILPVPVFTATLGSTGFNPRAQLTSPARSL